MKHLAFVTWLIQIMKPAFVSSGISTAIRLSVVDSQDIVNMED
jgi:hypothetical protein